MKIFKFFVVITLLITFISCSNDDNNMQNKSHFSPPNWIQGKWSALHEPGLYEFRFDHNNFHVNAGGETNYNDLINMTNSSSESKMIVNEEIDENSYYFTITTDAISNQFKFKKVSSTKIIYMYNGSAVDLYKK